MKDIATNLVFFLVAFGGYRSMAKHALCTLLATCEKTTVEKSIYRFRCFYLSAAPERKRSLCCPAQHDCQTLLTGLSMKT